MTYTNINGYNIPDLALPLQPEDNLGKYGRARLAYLKEYKPLLHIQLLTQGELWPHLPETQQTAIERVELLTTQMAAAQSLTEELKSRDQMEWLGRMNNIRAGAEEIVYQEVIVA